MTKLWGREPALILAAIQAAVALAVGFGLPVTPEQVALIVAFSAAALGVVVRSQVTPLGSVPAVTQDRLDAMADPLDDDNGAEDYR